MVDRAGHERARAAAHIKKETLPNGLTRVTFVTARPVTDDYDLHGPEAADAIIKMALGMARGIAVGAGEIAVARKLERIAVEFGLLKPRAQGAV